MARKSRTAVLKRQREVKKAEKAALKREKRVVRGEEPSESERIATAEDLEGYGFGQAEDEEPEAPPPAGCRPRRGARRVPAVLPTARAARCRPMGAGLATRRAPFRPIATFRDARPIRAATRADTPTAPPSP